MKEIKYTILYRFRRVPDPHSLDSPVKISVLRRQQCCGSGTFYSGAGSDLEKVPDPDLFLYIFWAGKNVLATPFLILPILYFWELPWQAAGYQLGQWPPISLCTHSIFVFRFRYCVCENFCYSILFLIRIQIRSSDQEWVPNLGQVRQKFRIRTLSKRFWSDQWASALLHLQGEVDSIQIKLNQFFTLQQNNGPFCSDSLSSFPSSYGIKKHFIFMIVFSIFSPFSLSLLWILIG